MKTWAVRGPPVCSERGAHGAPGRTGQEIASRGRVGGSATVAFALAGMRFVSPAS